MIPIVAGHGVSAMAELTIATLVGGLFHTALSVFVGRMRFALPPLVTDLIVLMIGISLMRVGVQYAAGSVPAQGTPADGPGASWLLAGIVVAVTLGLSLYERGSWSSAAVLLGLIAGLRSRRGDGRVSLAGRSDGLDGGASPFHFGFAASASAILGFCLTGFVSATKSIGVCRRSAKAPRAG